MLKSLYIKNFAIIKEQEITFDSGLNVITGETGSGKSIVFEALGLLLGNRASIEFVRKGEDKSIVEGTFSKQGFAFKNNDETIKDNFIIRKEIRVNGTSRVFLNDSPIQMNELKMLASQLANYHSQDENSILSDESTHISFYDSNLNLKDDLRNYKQIKYNIDQLYRELKNYLRKRNSSTERSEFLKFQLRDIDKVNPKKGELEKIKEKLKILENSEEILLLSKQLSDLLSSGNDSVIANIQTAHKLLNNLKRYNSEFENFTKELTTAEITIQEIANFSNDFASDIDLNPKEIEDYRNRALELRGLEKKFGSIDKALEKREEILDELELIDNFDEVIDRKKKEIHELELKIGEVAAEISQKRTSFKSNFDESITNKLKEMGIEYVVFDTQIEQNKTFDENESKAIIDSKFYQLYENGIDRIEFHASLNKGEEAKKISEFASGGELSRILLALKSLNNRGNNNPVLILDEIDTGISGKTSQLVGRVMKDISKHNQIIAITHSPQIAALANKNFATVKEVKEDRTYSNIRDLDMDEKIVEIAKLISGAEYTENSLRSAEELINPDY